MPASPTDYIGAALTKTNNVIATPIIGNVDTVHLFWVTGIFLIAVLIWSRILAHFPRG